MSQTFSIVCHEAKLMVWIGQGRGGKMEAFYYGDEEMMANLSGFLKVTQGKNLVVLCDEHDLVDDDYVEFKTERRR